MKDRFKKSKRVAQIGIIVNGLLAGFKIFAGVFGHSQAMVSDGFHSFSDILVSVFAFTGVKISEKPGDKDHPYGHGKAEAITALFISFFLFAVVILLSYRTLSSFFLRTMAVPALLPLFAGLVSISVKEVLFRYAHHVGKKFDNLAIIASAYDYRADAFSSIASVAGIAGARLGWVFLDPLAGFVVALFILKMAIRILGLSLSQLMDTSLPDDLINEIREVVSAVDGVRKIDEIKTRRMGWRSSIDLSVEVDASLSIESGHAVAEEIERRLAERFKNISNIMVHVNPRPDREEKDKRLMTITKVLESHYQKFVNFHDLSLVRKGEEEQAYLHLVLSRKISVEEAHRICNHLERDIRKELPDFKVLIHVEPARGEYGKEG